MPLLLLANRDEFYDRPSSPAEWWPQTPGVWGGRDLQAGGTWMGITREGRFAALTNFRSGVPHPNQARSRGMLVAEFLEGDATPADYAQTVMADAQAYNGFNLIVGDIYGAQGAEPSIWYCGNQTGALARALPAGLYGLSNAVLDTPWPKLTRLKARLSGVGRSREDLVDVCMAFLSDPTLADDSELPATGLSRERERALSPVFIVSPTYGTRAQTVVRADRSGMIEATERSYESAAQAGALAPAAVRRMRFRVPAGD